MAELIILILLLLLFVYKKGCKIGIELKKDN